MKKVGMLSLGCAKNRVDSENMLGMLRQRGYEIVSDPAEADVLFVNTCGFILDAKQESIQALLGAAATPHGHLYAFGCLSQRYSAELEAEIPEVERWFGARDLDPVLRAMGVRPDEKLRSARHYDGLPYAYLKVSEGCDRRCSYCAIPHIRGAHRSVPLERIVSEAEFLASKGVKELLLIAQDTTYYGLDLYGERRLADVLKALSQIDGIERLRIHYSYPEGFPADVLRELADNPKVCRYMDIPLQHISDRVLGCMHRNVTSAWTRSLIGRLRDEVPGVVLRTTLIVGHPGEGEAEFRELLDFVEEARFERLGAFRYSEEEGTWGAAHLKDDVPAEEKQRRYDALMQLQQGISASYNESRVGRVYRVLVDAVAGNTLVARSEFESPEVDGEILVSCPEGTHLPGLVGKFVDVRITEALDYDLLAELAI